MGSYWLVFTNKKLLKKDLKKSENDMKTSFQIHAKYQPKTIK